LIEAYRIEMVATMEDQRKSLAKKLYQISGESKMSETLVGRLKTMFFRSLQVWRIYLEVW
jgi:hypothetical protein